MKSLCVFCGATPGNNAVYRQAAQAFGETLAQNNIELVWGGGHVGLMGVVADAVLAAGGRTYGVIPSFMAQRELAHPGTTELVVVNSMHERKAAMAERADAFVALPGGFGTLDELFEIVTWAQLQIHRKPVGLLNVGAFFDPLIAMVRHMSLEGFIRPHYLSLLQCADEPADLLQRLDNYRAPEGDWVGQKLTTVQS